MRDKAVGLGSSSADSRLDMAVRTNLPCPCVASVASSPLRCPSILRLQLQVTFTNKTLRVSPGGVAGRKLK
eukprot:7742092-Pyramimonas_sp.AAC.1